MNISADGVAAISTREGFKLQAYRDVKGIWTIGVGHTGPEVHRGLVWTIEVVEITLANDLERFVAAVNNVGCSLTQNEFDACVSLAFNIGVGGFEGSSVVKQLKAGNKQAAADDFLMWEKPPSLRARREGERRQFLGEM